MWKYFKRRNDNKFQSRFLYNCFLSQLCCVYAHNSYTKKRPFIYTTHLPRDITNNRTFSRFCPRALGFKLLCWPLLTNGEKLLPLILSHPPCMPLVHNDIFEALNLFAKGTKCRCLLGLRLVTCRRKNRS